MYVPIVAGSDKTTESVATGGQEYHPVYASIGNIKNTARRGHGNGVVPVAFLPIPKSMLDFLFCKFAEGLIMSKPANANENGQISRCSAANCITLVST